MKKANKNIVPSLNTHIPYYFVSKGKENSIIHGNSAKERENGDMNGLYKEKLTQYHFVGHMKIATPTISHSCSSCAVRLAACWPRGHSGRSADGLHQRPQRPG